MRRNFVSGKTADQPAVAGLAGDALRHRRQQDIAGMVTDAVIDGAETIQSQAEQHAGQGIHANLLPQAAEGLFQPPDHDVEGADRFLGFGHHGGSGQRTRPFAARQFLGGAGGGADGLPFAAQRLSDHSRRDPPLMIGDKSLATRKNSHCQMITQKGSRVIDR